jgi:hypothetical protein
MDLTRIRSEVAEAQAEFAFVEYHQSANGPYVLAALQANGNPYTLQIDFPSDYPNSLPLVTVRRPTLVTNCVHRYNTGHLCYMHPSFWNPGRHTLKVVLWRVAKWLNKYEVWKVQGEWPGKEVPHAHA